MSVETGVICSCIRSTVRASYTCLDDPGHTHLLFAANSMNMLTIEVWDATGNKKQLVELPPDAPVNRVIAVLVEKMNLPRYSPDGQLMSYKFHHKASGRQLLDDQTLASADIHSGDVLRLQPEITAGRTTRPPRDGA
jgi:WXG100 protein secretion system (Wss), protein YukD